MATIGKTFSDPDKWEEPWFTSLSPGKKLLFCYLWERCDHAGVIHITPAIWSAHTGLKVEQALLDDFVENVNEGLERVAIFGKRLWFTEYIRFNQQSDISLPLSDKYSFHKHVYKIIRKHGLTDEVNKRDPILLENFLQNENDVSVGKTIHPKPYLRLDQDLDKPTGKGPGKGRGGGGSGGKGLIHAKDTEHQLHSTNLEKDMRNTGELNGTPF